MKLCQVLIHSNRWRQIITDCIRAKKVLGALAERTRFGALFTRRSMPHVVFVADLRVGSLVAIGWFSGCFDLIRKSSCCPTHTSHSHSVLIYSTLSWSSYLIPTSMRWRRMLRSLRLLRVHSILYANSKGRWCSCNDGLRNLWECIGTTTLQCFNSGIIWTASYGNALITAFMALSSVRVMRKDWLYDILSDSAIAEVQMGALRMLVDRLWFYTLFNSGFRLLVLVRSFRLFTLKSDQVKLRIWEIQILLLWFTTYLRGFASLRG